MKNIDSVTRNIQPEPKPAASLPNQPINLLKVKSKAKPKKTLKRILILISLIIFALVATIAMRAANLSDKIFVGQKTSFFSKIAAIIRGGGDNQKLVGEDLGQINILLLGIGGEGHDGPYLTDTIIVAQIRPDIGSVSLTSIPRDYWSAMPHSAEHAKINQAFSNGYIKNHDWNEGGQYALEAAQNLSGLQIPYFMVLDFSGFEKAVNQVGGVDVHIDRTFTDNTYPDSGTGYLPPITFTVGDEHMDGTRALEFARSRHAEGPEGSDFARSQRQQKIIQAFKQKALSLNLFKDASTINSLLDTFADHFHTNLSPAQMFRVFNLIKNNNIKDFVSLSLDPDTSIICPQILPDTGAYVLLPCPGKTEQDIKGFFKNSFTTGKVTQEKSVVWLSTSTGDRAAYTAASNKLQQAGAIVWELPYKGPILSQNILYQANSKPATADFIKNSLNATEVALPPPGVNADKSKVDIIVILGQNN